MSKSQQIILGVVAFLVIFFLLVPMLPADYHLHFIAYTVVVIAAILWVMKLGGIEF